MSEDKPEFTFHARADEEACRDGKPHVWAGWQEFEDGRGGTMVCSVCGLSAFEHSMRYGP
jgi:hypothetical protein